MSIQMYECRLKKAGVLRVSDVSAGDSAMSAQDVGRIGSALVRGVPHEQVWLLLLNGKNLLQGAIRLAEGGLHGAALTPADVLRPVLTGGAGSFVLLHNHPSGDPTPSMADVELTRKIVGACEPMGLYFLDHVVVTSDPNVWRSMREISQIFE